eukprot:Skav213999  [mRNA]  locus=scaffold1070:43711:44268:- [translate_table: standard]
MDDQQEQRAGELIAAVHGRQDTVVEHLLQRPQDPDVLWRDGCFRVTALGEACLQGSTDIVRLLLEARADSNKMFRERSNRFRSTTPLEAAAREGKVEIARMLLEAGANKDEKSGDFDETPLGVAACRGHVEMVRLLLDAGADKNMKTFRFVVDPKEKGYTPLAWAWWNRHAEATQALEEAGALWE